MDGQESTKEGLKDRGAPGDDSSARSNPSARKGDRIAEQVAQVIRRYPEVTEAMLADAVRRDPNQGLRIVVACIKANPTASRRILDFVRGSNTLKSKVKVGSLMAAFLPQLMSSEGGPAEIDDTREPTPSEQQAAAISAFLEELDRREALGEGTVSLTGTEGVAGRSGPDDRVQALTAKIAEAFGLGGESAALTAPAVGGPSAGIAPAQSRPAQELQGETVKDGVTEPVDEDALDTVAFAGFGAPLGALVVDDPEDDLDDPVEISADGSLSFGDDESLEAEENALFGGSENGRAEALFGEGVPKAPSAGAAKAGLDDGQGDAGDDEPAAPAPEVSASPEPSEPVQQDTDGDAEAADVLVSEKESEAAPESAKPARTGSGSYGADDMLAPFMAESAAAADAEGDEMETGPVAENPQPESAGTPAEPIPSRPPPPTFIGLAATDLRRQPRAHREAGDDVDGSGKSPAPEPEKASSPETASGWQGWHRFNANEAPNSRSGQDGESPTRSSGEAPGERPAAGFAEVQVGRWQVVDGRLSGAAESPGQGRPAGESRDRDDDDGQDDAGITDRGRNVGRRAGDDSTRSGPSVVAGPQPPMRAPRADEAIAASEPGSGGSIGERAPASGGGSGLVIEDYLSGGVPPSVPLLHGMPPAANVRALEDPAPPGAVEERDWLPVPTPKSEQASGDGVAAAPEVSADGPVPASQPADSASGTESDADAPAEESATETPGPQPDAVEETVAESPAENAVTGDTDRSPLAAVSDVEALAGGMPPPSGPANDVPGAAPLPPAAPEGEATGDGLVAAEAEQVAEAEDAPDPSEEPGEPDESGEPEEDQFGVCVVSADSDGVAAITDLAPYDAVRIEGLPPDHAVWGYVTEAGDLVLVARDTRGGDRELAVIADLVSRPETFTVVEVEDRRLEFAALIGAADLHRHSLESFDSEDSALEAAGVGGMLDAGTLATASGDVFRTGYDNPDEDQSDGGFGL